MNVSGVKDDKQTLSKICHNHLLQKDRGGGWVEGIRELIDFPKGTSIEAFTPERGTVT